MGYAYQHRPQLNLVPTICQIIDLVPKDKHCYIESATRHDLVNGLREAMVNLISMWEDLELLLKVVFSKYDYAFIFLTVLSKSNWNFDDFTIVDQFVSQLKQEDKLRKFTLKLMGEMKFSVEIENKALEEINTIKGLLTWIYEAMRRKLKDAF